MIKRLFFFQTSSTLWSIPTIQTQDILLKNYNNCHHSITNPSYFYHLFTQLLLCHSSLTTNSTFFFRPPQLIPPSFNPKHPSTLVFSISPSANNTHHSSAFSILHKLLSFHSVNQISSNKASYACTLQDAGLHFPFYGRQMPPTPTFGAVGAHNN